MNKFKSWKLHVKVKSFFFGLFLGKQWNKNKYKALGMKYYSSLDGVVHDFLWKVPVSSFDYMLA